MRESDDSDVSDHEEEFYYTEIEISVDAMTRSFADMHTSSPPRHPTIFDDIISPTPQKAVSSDHDYQKKVRFSYCFATD